VLYVKDSAGATLDLSLTKAEVGPHERGLPHGLRTGDERKREVRDANNWPCLHCS